MKGNLKPIILSVFLIACFFSSFGQKDTQTNADSLSVVKSLDNFLDAFTNLKRKEFSACFADEATAFFPPSAKFPYRANNKKEVEDIFSRVFENAKKGKSTRLTWLYSQRI